jgi:hypothetical protein
VAQASWYFAVERFTDADHLRERSFDVPSDFKLDEILHGHSASMSAHRANPRG